MTVEYTYDQCEKLPKEWVSVDVALPPLGLEVLVYSPHKPNYPVTALSRYKSHDGARDYYWDNDRGRDNMHLREGVTMWCPLPDPPAQ